MKKQGGYFFIFILAFVGAGVFYGGNRTNSFAQAGNAAGIVISEAQFYPTSGRFIELYNLSDSAVDLTDWYLQRKTASANSFFPLVSKTYFSGKTIAAHDYFLISRASLDGADIVIGGLTLTYANTIQLKNAGGEVVDKVGWTGAGDCEGVCAAFPAEDQSSQRKFQNNVFTDSDNNADDFEIQNCPSPKAAVASCQEVNDDQDGVQEQMATSTPAGGQNEEETEPPAAENSEEDSTSATAGSTGQNTALQKVNLGDAVINELVSDPADNEVEWIELYNKSGREIDLSGWRLEDGSKAKTRLDGVIGVNGFKVIDKPAGNLNNGGDLVTLYDLDNKIIDQVAYGGWDNGDLRNNAPAAPDPDSLARIFDGYNTFNNANDFAITIKPTKGAANIIQTEDEVSPAEKAKFDFSPDIYLSELLPNPAGNDAQGEFIEIHNAGPRQVDLTGWSLSNEKGKKVYLEKIATTTVINAGQYLALYRPETKIVLYNNQGEARLFQPLADKPLRIVKYKDVKEGWSYNSANAGWVWSEAVTPGAANVIQTVNHPPEAAFSFPPEILAGQPLIFDGSDTMDADGDGLSYAWDFGDGFTNTLASPQHTYFKAGIYMVKLTVSDGKETAEKEKSVKVVSNLNEMSNVREIAKPVPSLSEGSVFAGAPRNDSLIINEIFPDPAGADSGQEWLELKNAGAEKINLLNWRVENSNGRFKFKNDLWLEAADFYVLDNALSKLAFKNSSDAITLHNDLGELVDMVEYANAVQGESYARGENGKWFWTTKLTPGGENVISVAASAVMNNGLRITGNTEVYLETDLEKARELEIGSLVKVKGTVAVEPGILGAQIFYITGSPGIQIYNYKKDFPALTIGDYVEVTGELARAQGELRIKTKAKDDIIVAGRGAPPPALAITSEEATEENVGRLVELQGEITDRKSSTLYLDDGNDEVLVYIKKNSGIAVKNLAVGQTAAVTGILSRTQSGVRLLPRHKDDIALINSGHEQPAGQVLGQAAAAANDEWELEARDKKTELFKYLLIIAGAVIAVLAGLLVKAGKK